MQRTTRDSALEKNLQFTAQSSKLSMMLPSALHMCSILHREQTILQCRCTNSCCVGTKFGLSRLVPATLRNHATYVSPPAETHSLSHSIIDPNSCIESTQEDELGRASSAASSTTRRADNIFAGAAASALPVSSAE